MKIVTSEEMQRIEHLSFQAGILPDQLMDLAGESMAAFVMDWLKCPSHILLLVGKGNNGADALTVGTFLLQNHYVVSALLVYPVHEMSLSCKARLERFKQAGGSAFKGNTPDLIIDGIVGTGFYGGADGLMKKAIEWANDQAVPILAVDIPSAVNGTTGHVESMAIRASMTCCLGLPKIGCFIGQGWNFTGECFTLNQGYPTEALAQANPTAFLFEEKNISLPPIHRTWHKYERGYVLGIGGSHSMPGAISLAALATLRSGAGIIRLFTDAPFPFPMEVIAEPINLERIQQEMQRADAMLVGPGLGRSLETKSLFQQLLPLLTLPTVIDGDGLYHLASMNPFSLPAGSVLTPHRREMTQLIKEEPTLESCQRFAETYQLTLILKGAPTLLFHPEKKPLIITAGDPGMATAGCGDVLTGMVAAFLAQKMKVTTAASLAVYLHGLAGELAAEKMTSYSMMASDLIAHIPGAFQQIAAFDKKTVPC